MRASSILGFSTLVIAAAITLDPAQAQQSSYADVSSALQVDTTTTIPGINLKPGSYTIRLVDNLKDRYILSVADDHKKDLATFIGMLQHGPLPGQVSSGPVLWANSPGKTNALRGFSFSNGQVFEFVYPKAMAVELAKINASSVPAIDPESEGMPVDPKLSAEDRKVVTLWLLTSTRVGPGKGIPAIEAKRAQPQTNTEVAQVWTPRPIAGSKVVAASPVKAAKPDTAPTRSANVAAARPGADLSAKTKPRTVAVKLPQTASDFPLVLLLSCILVASGFGVAIRRQAFSRT